MRDSFASVAQSLAAHVASDEEIHKQLTESSAGLKRSVDRLIMLLFALGIAGTGITRFGDVVTLLKSLAH